MQKYLDVFINAYTGYANYLIQEITHPSIHNYFYWLVILSLFFYVLELARPWRPNQPKFRKDFWLDAFYMFFNFFLFSLIIYNGISSVVSTGINDLIISLTGFEMAASNPLWNWPRWSILLVAFIVRDFIQWWTHRLLHRVPALWEFHKVHHSIIEMGFAGHLRYHWMETLVYKSIEYLPLAFLFGLGLHDFFVVHILALAIGHYNHSNLKINKLYAAGGVGVFAAAIITTELNMDVFSQITWFIGIPLVFAFGLGPWMKYIFNSPEMHIWHHAKDMPDTHPYGINFGISLAIWDYIFGTAKIPHDGKDIALGFPGIEKFPQSFAGHLIYGLVPQKKEK
jgi:sterol desaturase/sphingolipid hydroxylase (fatty acid hydroxylase superfamily)